MSLDKGNAAEPLKAGAEGPTSGLPGSHAKELITVLCQVQAGAAIGTALAALVVPNSALLFGPLLAAAGFLVALVGMRRVDGNLVALGVSAPILTAIGAAVISVSRGSRFEPAGSLRLILAVYAGVCVPWAVLALRESRPAKKDGSSHDEPFQFQIWDLLKTISVVCVMMAILRLVSLKSQLTFLGMYGLGVFYLVVVLMIAYCRRALKRIDDGGD